MVGTDPVHVPDQQEKCLPHGDAIVGSIDKGMK